MLLVKSGNGYCTGAHAYTQRKKERNCFSFEDGCLLGCGAFTMEAARTSETLVNFYQTTRCYNPEDSHLRTHRHENLKSYCFSYPGLIGLTPLYLGTREFLLENGSYLESSDELESSESD
jgi:hypothetical protein